MFDPTSFPVAIFAAFPTKADVFESCQRTIQTPAL
jgi:hypothetical protein